MTEQPSTPEDPLVEEGAGDPLVEEGAGDSLVEEGAPRPSRNQPAGFGDVAGEVGDDTEVELTDDLARAQADAAKAQQDVAALTSDLQRLQAEYLNYKRRVDRDRELIRENATYSALAPVTEVVDAIDRAREHGPLEEGLRAVAEQLERAVAGVGLIKYGAPGDPFDPTLHDALSHVGEDPDVAVTTCQTVVRAGYRMGDRVVRAAQVLVVDPPSRPTASSVDEPHE